MDKKEEKVTQASKHKDTTTEDMEKKEREALADASGGKYIDEFIKSLGSNDFTTMTFNSEDKNSFSVLALVLLEIKFGTYFMTMSTLH